jgi:pimeloyl-ACP methyl ester carboxylesterase
MGLTAAPDEVPSAEDVLDVLLDFASEVTGAAAHRLIGHSAGTYRAQAMATRVPAQVTGLALVCPLLPGVRNVTQHRAVVGAARSATNSSAAIS